MASRRTRLMLAQALIIMACALAAGAAHAQTQPSALRESTDQKAGQAQPDGLSSQDDRIFKDIYRDFYNSYKLGPGDEIAIRVQGQPDYTLDKVEISPVGRIYHPLVGELEVAGVTVTSLKNRLTTDFSQYIIDPKVSVSLLKASSAKVGVLGDISRPGILVMSGPMTVLDAITASGGVSSLGSQSNITLVRQGADGRMKTVKVNVKRILEGKAGAEENVALQSGDTLIVHGNLKKKIGSITSILGFSRFLDFLIYR